eukprot:10319521-Karenia_brevis.AAC.1
MTNASELLKTIHRRCEGGHEHGRLMSGRAKEAAVYPPALCRAVVHGIKQQIAWDHRRHDLYVPPAPLPQSAPEMAFLEIDDSDDEDMMPELMDESDDEDEHKCGEGVILEFLTEEEEDSDEDEWEAEDDVKGGPLDPDKVHEARKTEMQYVWDRGIY